ncbi:MAG: hypothetical protein AAF206_26210, partial [Bacteroidota bacterium]
MKNIAITALITLFAIAFTACSQPESKSEKAIAELENLLEEAENDVTSFSEESWEELEDAFNTQK